MSNQNLSTNPPANQSTDWREQRREWRRSGGGAWIGGLVLIAIGLIILLENFGGAQFKNWWALFILIPAIGSLSTGWFIYRQAGRLNRAARGALFSGLVFLAITAFFLFDLNLNWNLVLPIGLIVIGIAMLINFMLPD